MKDGFVVLNINNDELWDNLKKHGKRRKKNSAHQNMDNGVGGDNRDGRLNGDNPPIRRNSE